MKAWMLRLVAEFLSEHADRLGNDGCNDYYVPSWVPRDELLAAVKDWDKNNPDDEDNSDLLGYNWAVCESLAHAMKAEAARMEAAK